MDRRRILAAAGATVPFTLAGCVFGAGEPREPPADDPSGTDSTSEPVVRLVTLERVDAIDDHDIAIDVSLENDTVTPEESARVRVTATNDGPPRNLSFSDGKCSLFNREQGASTPAGLWLHDPASAERIARSGDRWSRDRAADVPRSFETYECKPSPYDTGDTVSADYLMWDDYRTPGYMEPDTYRFAQDITVYEYADPRPPTDPNVLDRFRWGFDIRVETGVE